MIQIVIKLVKFLVIIFVVIIPVIWFFPGSFGGNEYDKIIHFIHPIIIYLIIKIIVKQTYVKAYLFTGAVLLIEHYGKSLFYMLFHNNEIASNIEKQIEIVDKMTMIYAIILIFGVLIKYVVFKNKGERKNKQISKRQAYSFEFETLKGKVFLDNPFRGIYIQGGAGSGKGGSLFNPIITQAAINNFSGILYDFKSPELSKHAFHEFRKYNKQIDLFFVDFKNPLISDRVNPINPENLLKAAYAFEFSEAIINNLLPETVKQNEFFGRSALSILSGTIWFMKKKHPEKCTLPHIISLFLHSDISNLLENIKEEPEAYGMVVSLKQAIERGSERQVASVLATLQNALARLNTADIFWILSGDDFSLDVNNPDSPKFVCVGNDSSLPKVYAPVISLIISVASKIMNNPGKHQSIIILDEAPTLYIPNFEQIPATARSNKVVTVYGAQDYSQMVDCYEENKAQVILSNLGSQFYGRTINEKSTNMIKNMFSREDKIYETKSKNDGTSGQYIHFNSSKGKGMSESVQERDRVKVSDITTMEPGEFYGVIAEGEPKELLKAKFKYHEVNSKDVVFKEKTTQIEIDENYNRIVMEAKNLFNNNDFEQKNDSFEFKID